MPPTLKLVSGQWLLAAATLACALVLGGGQGTPGDTLCQLLATVLVGVGLVRHWRFPEARLPRLAWIAVVPFLLPLVQLLPVPEFLWNAAPARVAIAAQMEAAGVDPQMRMGLLPLATERALVWMLPALALFLSGLQFGQRQRLGLLLIFLALALAHLVLGMAQLATGPESALRFYDITNPGSAVGFFANRNHLATLLAMSLPFVILGSAARAGMRREAGMTAIPWLAVGGIAATGLVLGLGTTGSRAGQLLGVLAFAICAVPAIAVLAGPRRRVLALAAVVGVAGMALAIVGLVRSAGVDTVDESRVHFAGITLEAAGDHAPLGTGLGGFRRAFEGYDTEAPLNVYVNHAHSDPVELWLEGSWLALLLALPVLAGFAIAGVQAWRDRGRPGDDAWMRQAAWIALLLVLAHSLVDYPLRTTAILALSGLLAAVTVRTRRRPASPPNAG